MSSIRNVKQRMRSSSGRCRQGANNLNGQRSGDKSHALELRRQWFQISLPGCWADKYVVAPILDLQYGKRSRLVSSRVSELRPKHDPIIFHLKSIKTCPARSPPMGTWSLHWTSQRQLPPSTLRASVGRWSMRRSSVHNKDTRLRLQRRSHVQPH